MKMDAILRVNVGSVHCSLYSNRTDDNLQSITTHGRSLRKDSSSQPP